MDRDEVVARLRSAGCVFAEDEATLLLEEALDPHHLERLLADRCSGTPLEHVVGWAAFCGIRVPVDRGVFVPRPRSELLVSQTIAALRPGGLVLDLCCGSGAIGAAVATALPVRVVAADIDPRAVDNARRTLAGRDATVLHSDLFEGLPAEWRGSFDAIAVVAPYVPTAALGLLPHEARDFEPRSALDGGADGLDVVRRIASDAPGWLREGGVLLTEIADHQSTAAADAFRSAGLDVEAVVDDEAFLVSGRLSR